MEQILYICLGALLALFGGVVTQWIQNYFNQKKEDKDLLYQALCILIAWKEPTQDILQREFKNIVIRIRSRCYRSLASRLFELPNIENDKKRENMIEYLILKSCEAINKPFVKKEIKDMEDLPEKEKKGGLRMNKPQKIVIGITIILIGCILIMFIALTTDIMFSWKYVPEFTISSLFVGILGIVLVAGGLIVLFSIKKR